jgi:hypothetical protein
MINTESIEALKGLLKTKIPLKRTAVQREQHKNLNNSDDDCADDKADKNDDSDYDQEVDETDAYKRKNDGADGVPLINIDL